MPLVRWQRRIQNCHTGPILADLFGANTDLPKVTVGKAGNVRRLCLDDKAIGRGQLLETEPAVERENTADMGFVTLGSVDGSTNFRALIEPAVGAPGVNSTTQAGSAARATVIALPTAQADESIRQLTLTLTLLVLFTAALLSTLAFWTTRLGLRPISEITDAATAIAGGERNQRVPVLDPRTEAGQLSAAFNEMLDQKEAQTHACASSCPTHHTSCEPR